MRARDIGPAQDVDARMHEHLVSMLETARGWKRGTDQNVMILPDGRPIRVMAHCLRVGVADTRTIAVILRAAWSEALSGGAVLALNADLSVDQRGFITTAATAGVELIDADGLEALATEAGPGFIRAHAEAVIAPRRTVTA